jgi:DNA mismatch repair protein MutS
VRERGDGIVFLHRIADGAADRSYGIHVAQLAGMPPRVLARAREVLHELERSRTVEDLGAAGVVREKPRRARGEAPELPLFAAPEHPVADALRQVSPDTLTPLDALNLIAEWKRRYGDA